MDIYNNYDNYINAIGGLFALYLGYKYFIVEDNDKYKTIIESTKIGEDFKAMKEENIKELLKQGKVFKDMCEHIKREKVIYNDSEVYAKIKDLGDEVYKQENEIKGIRAQNAVLKDLIFGLETKIEELIKTNNFTMKPNVKKKVEKNNSPTPTM